ncbi:carbohydrate ABC transporter permease [Paenibacillus sp.]|uniref:carbohydrate ABC transporter permease n=1 Tax=Paenibacillus sp. TaxID=58172 RepID=UPI002D44802F|nr:carbohydrate ABC transporter permease [Paenibacillus sp.]HZG57049.1 carbohydrate ABC transporter permease [Paenibacillus sp.]
MTTTVRTEAPTRRAASKRLVERIQALLSYALLIAGAIVILAPFVWMISTSLKRKIDVYVFPPEWIPDPIMWSNYPQALTTFPFGLYTLNSVTIVAFVMIGTLLSCSFSSYGFARLKAPGKDFIFIVLLSTLMLPTAVTMVPLFLMFNSFGWIDTFLPLIVPSFFGNAFFIFLMRQFYMGVPRELEDAAKIDGCNAYSTWVRILVPLTMPVVATAAVFTFMWTWNDFMGPLIYLTDESKRTIALGLSYFQGSARSSPELHLLMAATLISIIPCVLLFFFSQKVFVKGIVFTGVKG